MLINELSKEAQNNAIEEFKKSSYFTDCDPNLDILEAIEENQLYFNEDGTIFGEYRICSHCGKVMIDGYLIDEGAAYYCSDECLYSNMTEEEYQELYKEDIAFYTEWY